MEYWTGWFTHWNEPHPERSLSSREAADGLKTIVSKKSAVNLYMFHGKECICRAAIIILFKMLFFLLLSTPEEGGSDLSAVKMNYVNSWFVASTEVCV